MARPRRHSPAASPPSLSTAPRPAVRLVLAGPRRRVPCCSTRCHSPAGRRARPPEPRRGCGTAGQRAQPSLGKKQQSQRGDGERAKLTSLPPTLRPSCPEVRCPSPRFSRAALPPPARDTPPLPMGPENFTPSPKSGLRGRCPELDRTLLKGSGPGGSPGVGGRRPAGNFIIAVITTFYCFSPRRGCSQRSVARACVPEEPPRGEDPARSCSPREDPQPSRGGRAAWLRRTQPRSRGLPAAAKFGC